jgi:hypothetical protein
MYITVRWSTAFSYFVCLKAGVRQGGILSPQFFIAYVDKVLVKLTRNNLGCHVHGVFVGAIMYADDLLISAISVCELQKMINLCLVELANLDMIVNVNKTMCIRIGRRCNSKCANIVLNGQPLRWVSEIRYLGVYIVSNRTFKISLDEARKKFFIACNSILSKVDKNQISVILSLIKSFCIPVLLYGVEACEINLTERTRIENCFKSVFTKLFYTYSKEIIVNCQFYTGCLPLNIVLDLRKLCFLRKLSNMQETNFIVNFLFKTVASDEFVLCASKYAVYIDDSDFTTKRKIWTWFETSIIS